MRENIKHIHSTLFIYKKGLLFQLKVIWILPLIFYIDLDRVGQAAVGGSLLFTFYYFPFATRQHWTKTNFSTKLEDKISKDKFFVDRKAGQKFDTTHRVESGSGSAYITRAFRSQKSVAETQPEKPQQHQPWRWQGRGAGSLRTRSWRRTRRWGRWSLTTSTRR